MPKTLIFLAFRTVSANRVLIFVSMKSAYSKRFLSASPNETECDLYAKRNKAESGQKIKEKEEQQNLEQSIHCGSKDQTSSRELLYSSERQNNWALEKQSCDTARKTCSNEGLARRVSENEAFTKKWSPENEDQSPTEDDMSLNVGGQPLETELLNVSSTADTCQNPLALNSPQVQQNNSTEQNNKRHEDNELKQNSSVTSLNRHMFHTKLLSPKSDSNKKWQRYQLFQIPFLSGTNSMFSCVENKKSKFLKNVYFAEDKNYSSCNKETTAEKDNKEKNNSMYIMQTLKPLKSIPPLEIPNFQFPRISIKRNSEQSSTNFRETDWKNFEGEPSLMQSKQIHGLQKMSEIGKQKLQNDKSSVRASAVGSELKEKNCPPINKQEHNTLAEGELSGTYFRCNSTDTECNKIFAENDFKDKIMENSESDDDQKSKIHIYISAKNVQNEKCVSSNDLLQRRGRKSTNESVGMFHIHMMNIPVTTETLEKNKLNVHCGVHDSNRDICLYEAESKLTTKKTLDFQSYVTKNITFKSNCSCIIVQDLPYKRVSCNVFMGKEMLKLKFSFQDMSFGWSRMWTESFHEDMPTCQDDSATPWSHCRDTLKEHCDAQELVRSTINRSHNDKIFMCLLAVVSKHLKVEVLKKMLASFFSSTNTILTTEGKSVRGEKQSLCGRKQNQLNSCTDSLRQTTGFLKENETYPGFVSSKLVESIDFELHNGYQRRCFYRTLGEEEYPFLQRGALFHNQKGRLCKGRRVRKHHLLSRVSEGFSTDLRSVSHKNSMKKQILPAKYLVLLQGSSDSSSLHKTHYCNITKVQYLIRASLGYQSYFPADSQPKFEKVHKRSTNQEISVNILKQEKNKPTIRLNSSFHVQLFKAIPSVLYENRKHKTSGYRHGITTTNEVTNEITYTMKKYLSNSSYRNADEKECVNPKELEMSCHDFLYKKSFSIFDIYEKIPLATDSEDFDQIPLVKQDSSIQKKLCEESAVTGSKEIQCLPVKSNDVLTPAEQPKATTEYNSLLLLDRQINKHENCKDLDTCSPHLANKKVDNQNTYLFSENLFPSSSNIYQSVTLPLDNSPFVNREISEDGHCRNSSSSGKQKASETIPAMVQYLSEDSPAMTDTYLQLQGKETAPFSVQGHEHTGSSEPATLKQHLEYVKEQEERNYEQMHVTNESQCGTVMNSLIVSYSEDKSETFIAADEELKMPLSIMNNGCLEDVKDKYLPLENKITHEFELKRKFDLVLEELRMFHEISKENVNNLSSLETNLPNTHCKLNNAEGIDKNMARDSQRKIGISSPICSTTKEKHTTDINESSLHEKILIENEDQKVSKECSISRMSSKELLHSPEEGKHI